MQELSEASGIGFPAGARVPGSCGLPDMRWETNLNSLQEQRMFLTPEPFPQPLIHAIVYNDNSSIFLCGTSLYGMNVRPV